MSNYYLDSSALVKRYVNEVGSDWIRGITDPNAGNIILLSGITLAEVSAATSAKTRAPEGITKEQRDRALSLFLQECDEHFTLLSVDRMVIARAVELAQTHPLRGYDAVQLATALGVNQILEAEGFPALTFITADTDLLTASKLENLKSQNPLDH